MILVDLDILKERDAGNIVIDPFDIGQLNPNSYNIRLGPRIMTYNRGSLDLREKNPETSVQEIPEAGFLLEPERLYLAETLEWTETYNLVPKIEGRSSVGRLGLFIHVTAGFGDVGFRGRWTLELFAIQPIRVYAGEKIGQISYLRTSGPCGSWYNGKYQNAQGVQASRFFKDHG
ncbi:MAG: dCTP deaminase [Spirochaetales bacterium]|nr:dCTP deaminase [Spirochaetales bacterium]